MSTDLGVSATERPAEQLARLGNAIEVSAAINAAHHVGVLDLLGAAPCQAAEVAQHCATALEPTELLLEALHAVGVLQQRFDGRYTTALETGWCATLVSAWSHLDQVIRTGTPLVAADTPSGAGELYPEVVAVLSELFVPAAKRAAELLAPVSGDVLDVGAGAAPWSIPLAAADPHTRVTALDVPEVLRATRRAVETADVTDRFEFLAGDMFTAELPPSAFDLILLGNVCHLFSAQQNRTLLGRLRPALRVGGTLAVIDMVRSDDPDEHRRLSLYTLGLRLRTTAGTVHPVAAYSSWTRDAGYGTPTTTLLSTETPLSLLTFRASELPEADSINAAERAASER